MKGLALVAALCAVYMGSPYAAPIPLARSAEQWDAAEHVYGEFCENQSALSYSACIWGVVDGTVKPPPPTPKASIYQLRLQSLYGERCEVVGPKGSHAYGECLLRYADQDEARRRAAAAQIISDQRRSMVVQPIDPNFLRPKGTNCTSYVIGGITQVHCD